MLTEISQTEKGQILYVLTYMWNLIKVELVEKMVAGSWGWEKWGDESQTVQTPSYKINRI